MKQNILTIAATFYFIGSIALANNYNNGGVYEYTSILPDNWMAVYDDSSGNPTTVNMDWPAECYALSVHNNSVTNIYGATFWTNEYGLTAANNAVINMYNGVNHGGIQAYENGEINIYDGSIKKNLAIGAWAEVNIMGGAFVQGINLSDNCEVTVSGGTFQSGFNVAVLNSLYSGPEGGTLTIMGQDFQRNGLDIPYGTYTRSDFTGGFLTGSLLSGDPIANQVTLYEGGQLVLIPEPASCLLLATGTMMLIRKRK